MSFPEQIMESPFRVKFPKLKKNEKDKDREQGFNQKERKIIFAKLYSYYDFLIKVNLSNNQVVKWGVDNKNYRAFVGKGNNFQIIKQALKRR